ncbi:2-iminoacetate synthase ThiH [Salinimonas sediminis]|uniref:2-iminoacetate synthase ThiH n=1 Tax=Salinimonas sediminis TaxID=2303538 RepID=A0A346NRP9_9ALTE|nr:2-iminoacetate synthase ThiH [Salinimonas sediminis]AXR08206.1 2-iminoacetate synthase ThiH [Salinimonas sediminis]
MTPVADALQRMDWDDLSLQVYSKTPQDVERALAAETLQLDDFMALVSPAAQPYLPAMAARAGQLKRQRFGNTINMFVPLYLSNLCANECTYCGFTMSNRIKRKTLDMAEIESEARAIKAMGFNSVLLVTGEHETKVGMSYFVQAVTLLRGYFDYVMMEVQPLPTEDYGKLRQAGVNGVLVYQETYHRRTYAQYHLRGNKQDFDWRLQTTDRLGQAGMDKVGIAALLGLNDWRVDSIMTAQHAALLQKTYWRSRVSVGFPRLRPCAGATDSSPQTDFISERQLVQLICAHRLLHPNIELSISTRESAYFRDHIAALGITSMSAASQTQPGGYSNKDTALAQFDTQDNRSAREVASALAHAGLEPVWSDWLQGFSG